MIRKILTYYAERLEVLYRTTAAPRLCRSSKLDGHCTWLARSLTDWETGNFSYASVCFSGKYVYICSRKSRLNG